MDFIKAKVVGWNSRSRQLKIHIPSIPYVVPVLEEEISVYPLTKLSRRGIPTAVSVLIGTNIYVSQSSTGIFSRKAVQEYEYNLLEEGQIVQAKVANIGSSLYLSYKSLTFYCARKEVSNSYVIDLNDYFSVGQMVDVKILEKKGSNKYVTVSYKQAYPDTLENYHRGDVVYGRITSNLQPENCYFVEINPQIRGLMDFYSPMFKYGDKVICKVIGKNASGLRLEYINCLSDKS